MIIDIHTHTFPDKICPAVVEKLGHISHTMYFSDGSAGALEKSMAESGITCSVNLPAMTSPAQVERIHDRIIAEKEQHPDSRILSFGGMHPDYENVRDELHRLQQNGIPGIKLHPAYQHCDFDDVRYLRILDAAAQEGLIVLTHAGLDVGIYDRNYCSVRHILHALKSVHHPRLILAHMGNWACWEDVESDLAGAPVYFDTAFSLGPVTPYPGSQEPPIRLENLSEDAFLRLCRKHGTDRILFGTDSPWESQKAVLDRMNHLPFTEKEKEQIFCENAASLLYTQ